MRVGGEMGDMCKEDGRVAQNCIHSPEVRLEVRSEDRLGYAGPPLARLSGALPQFSAATPASQLLAPDSLIYWK